MEFIIKMINKFIGFIAKSILKITCNVLSSIAKTIVAGFLKMIVSAKKSNFAMFYTPLALLFVGYYNSLMHLAITALVVWLSVLFLKGLK